MPIFDYKCKHCYNTIEKIVKLDEADSQTCSICLSPVTRLISAPGGFTITEGGVTGSKHCAVKPRKKK